jgi:hypothetical protein
MITKHRLFSRSIHREFCLAQKMHREVAGNDVISRRRDNDVDLRDPSLLTYGPWTLREFLTPMKWQSPHPGCRDRRWRSPRTSSATRR